MKWFMPLTCVVHTGREFFVNPEHIAMLSKKPDGFVMVHLDSGETVAVKENYEDIKRLLEERRS